MIAIIRISGKVEISEKIENTLFRLRLRRKYACIVEREIPELIGMIKKVRNFVAYGKINKETLIKLIKKRGQLIDKKKKIDADKIAEEFAESKIAKKWQNFNLKPFFRLHPPRGGIKSKLHFPRGVLGDHQEKINNLIERML